MQLPSSQDPAAVALSTEAKRVRDDSIGKSYAEKLAELEKQDSGLGRPLFDSKDFAPLHSAKFPVDAGRIPGH